MRNEHPTKLVSVHEAAEMLGLSFWTLYKWASEGRLPSYKIGRRRLVSMCDLQDIIRRSRQESRQTKD